MNNIKIGKGTLVKNKKTKAGKTYDMLDLVIIDHKTGDEIGYKVFVTGTPSKFQTNDGEDTFFANVQLKGTRKAGEKGRFNEVTPVRTMEDTPSTAKTTTKTVASTDDAPF